MIDRWKLALAVWAATCGSLGVAGCGRFKFSGGGQAKLKADLQACRQQVQKLQRRQDGLQEVIVDQQKQIRSLEALGGAKRLSLLYTVTHIDLGRYTGGVNTKGNDRYDNAIKIFLQPLDAHGDAIKAAGELTVQLFDLAEPAKQNLLAQCHYSVQDLAKKWFSGFLAYHYTVECPFSRPPKHDEITVRVEFVDYLTGKHFTAQKVVKIKLPPPSAIPTQPAPATRPAKKT